MYRSADYRHQVLEISPPVPVDGETATAFARCVAAIDAAIRRSPAHWFYWLQTDDLVSLGLLPAARRPGRPPSARSLPSASLRRRSRTALIFRSPRRSAAGMRVTPAPPPCRTIKRIVKNGAAWAWP